MSRDLSLVSRAVSCSPFGQSSSVMTCDWAICEYLQDDRSLAPGCPWLARQSRVIDDLIYVFEGFFYPVVSGVLMYSLPVCLQVMCMRSRASDDVMQDVIGARCTKC